MPNSSDDMILDLTDIVERGSVPKTPEAKVKGDNPLNDIMSSGPRDDAELNELLSKLNEGREEPGHVVDPDEKLTMPGMDDMDALIKQIDVPPSGDPAEKPIQAHAKNSGRSEAGKELDDILNKVGDEAKAPANLDHLLDSLLDDAPAKKESQADQLNSLLDSLLDEPVKAETEKPVAAPDVVVPEQKIDREAEEKPEAPSATPQQPAAEEHIAHLDALNLDDLDELDAMLPEQSPEAGKEPVAAQEPAAADPAASIKEPESGPVHEVMPVPVSEPAQIAPAHDPEDIVHTAHEKTMPAPLADPAHEVDGLGLERIVDQISSDMNDVASQLTDMRTELEMLSARVEANALNKPHAETDANLEKRLAACEGFVQHLEARLGTLEAHKPAVEGFVKHLESRLAALEAQRPAVENFVLSLEARLSALEAQKTSESALGTQDLHAIDERLSRLETNAGQPSGAFTVDNLLENLRPEIEKSAAAAAAQVIREEIEALMAEE